MRRNRGWQVYSTAMQQKFRRAAPVAARMTASPRRKGRWRVPCSPRFPCRPLLPKPPRPRPGSARSPSSRTSPACSPKWATKHLRRSRPRPFPRCLKVATCWARRRPAPARRPPSRCRSSRASTSPMASRRHWCWRPRANWRSRWPRPSRSTPPTCPASRCCRSTAARATARSCTACAAACTSWSARQAA